MEGAKRLDNFFGVNAKWQLEDVCTFTGWFMFEKFTQTTRN